MFIMSNILDLNTVNSKLNFAHFTAVEQDILRLLASGASNREIAKNLFLSEGCIRVHLKAIYAKLNVKTRYEATLVSREFIG